MQHTVTATGMVPATPIATPIPRELTPLLPPERTCEVDIFVFSDSKRRNASNQKQVTRTGITKCVSYWIHMEKARTNVSLLEDALKIPYSTKY